MMGIRDCARRARLGYSRDQNNEGDLTLSNQAPPAATPRLRRTQAERSASTRARLVAAAVDALYRLGYPATSTVLVADLARVSRGAMLHQFATKAALMAAVVEASYAADIEAYRIAIAAVPDPGEQLLVIADVAWAQFRAPTGIAQTEIWMATRSDPELAAAVLPIHAAIFESSLTAQAWRFAACGITDASVSDGLLYHNVALLRGLALEYLLGTPEAALRPAVDAMKKALRDTITPTGKRQ